MNRRLFAPILLPILVLAACAAPSAEEADQASSDFSSRESVLVDFDFDGELATDSSWNPKQSIQDQFLYTIGHLNGDRSVGRLDKLTLTNIKTTPNADGSFKITYHAKMPVAWGKKNAVPATYSFTLPKNASFSGQEAFTAKYKDSCVDFAAHAVDSGSMWYYYRPRTGGCALTPADVVSFSATVTKSTENTTGKYPEYAEVWKDDELKVVSIFGKYEEGATSTGDAGIQAFNSFISAMKSTLGPLSLTTEPANVASSPAPGTTDVTFHAKLADGKKITVTALLVDLIATTPPAFDARYEALTPTADLIMYNGHAGLGQNVRALANKGRWVSGKYLLFFSNGCDTFAYVDGSLAQKRAPLNPGDASGTKYMDIITNAMPAYFASDSPASTALIKALMNVANPQSFEQIFTGIDTQQVVLVTGEEDNVFHPGMPIGSGGGGGGGGWAGFNENGTVAKNAEKRYQTPELPAGSYTISMTGTGDADLYVKAGAAPTTATYDCRPYTSGSKESCTVKLAAAGPIHVMVRGWAATSTYTLTGGK